MATAKNSPEDERWEPCPPGELSRMVERSRLARRNKAAVRGGIAAVGVLLLVASTWQWFVNSEGNNVTNFGGIACSTVQTALPKLLNDELDETTAEKVRVHLAHCDKCRVQAEQMGWVATQRHGNCEDPSCTHCQRQAELIARGLVRPEDAPSRLAMVRAPSPGFVDRSRSGHAR